MTDPLFAAERAVALTRRWARRVVRAGVSLTLCVCVGTVAACAVLAWWLQWPEARAYLAHVLEDATGVRVEGVAPEGIWPLTFRARKVTLTDPCGDWLELEQAAYAWELHVFPLKLNVTRLSAERATVLRPPAYAVTPEDPTPALTWREQWDNLMQTAAMLPEAALSLRAAEVRLPFLAQAVHQAGRGVPAGALEGELRWPGLSRLTWRERGRPENRAEITLNAGKDALPSLRIRAEERAGGPWAAFAGAAGPLTFEAEFTPEAARDDGQGLRWHAKGALGEIAAEAHGDAVRSDAGGFSAEAEGSFIAPRGSAALPAVARALIGERVRFDVRAQADSNGGWRVHSAGAEGAFLRVRAEGVALEQGVLSGAARVEAGPEALAAAGGAGAVTAELRLSGTRQAPELHAHVRAETPGAGFGVEAAALAGNEVTMRLRGHGEQIIAAGQGELEAEISAVSGNARLRGTLPGKDGAARAEGDLLLNEAALPALFPLKGIAPGALRLHVEGRRAPDGTLTGALATSAPFAGVTPEAEGEFHPQDGRWRASLRAFMPAMQEVCRRLAPQLALPPQGAVTMTAHASGTGLARTQGTAEAVFQGARFPMLPPEAAAMTGEAPRIGVTWETEGGLLRLPRAELNAKHGQLSLQNGALNTQGEGLAGDVSLSLSLPEGAEAGRAAALAGLHASGNATLGGSVTRPKAAATWRLGWRGSTADLAFKAERTERGAKVEDFRWNGPAGMSASGQASFSDGAAEGALTLAVPDAADVARLFGHTMPLAGALLADVRVAPQGSGTSVLAEASGTGLEGFGLRFDEARLHAELKDVAALEGLRFALSARGAGPSPSKAGGFTGNLTCEGQGSAADLSARCVAEGKGEGVRAASLKAEGRWRMPPNASDGTAEALRLEASMDDVRLTLTEPGLIHISEGTAYPERLRFKLNEGALSLEGAPPAKEAGALPELTLRARHIRLTPWLPERETELSGVVRLSGTRSAPLLDADLAATDPELADAVSSVRLAAHAGGGMGTVRLAAEPRGGGGPLLSLNAAVPLTFSLAPFRCDLSPSALLTGNVAADADLSRPAALFLPSGQDLRGRLRGNVTLAGTVSRPFFRGALRAEGVTYMHEAAGVALDHGVLELTAHDDSPLTLRGDFHAGSGKASLAGTVAVTAPYAFDMQVNADHAELPRSSVAHGVTQGQLRLAGTPEALTLAGGLTFSPMEITLPELPPASLPTARIRNPEALPTQPRVPPPASAPKPSVQGMPKIGLNVELNVPGKVYVSGRGLQTELRGKVKVTGTAAAPFASGQLRAVHGSFTLLDRELSVTEGVLRFSGAMPPSPYVTFKAETFTSELKAGIALEGPASDPQLRLTSEPVRPEDEILAHLLFGRELKSITPLQGVKLARAASQLRGGGGGGGGGGLLDITGKARALLGVDKLNVEQNESGEYEAGAGKYIGDKIYVGVQSGADPAKGRVTTETEITPNMTVETETGREGGGVRLNWKKDY